MKSRARSVWGGIALLVLAAGGLGGHAIAEPPLSGEALFRQGIGRDGRDISARIGEEGGVRMQGGNVACANCHGQDARGGSEGWIRPPDLRWTTLTAPQGRLRADGSMRPAYDTAGFARALRGGIASDGRPLDSVMPRYDLADDEIQALLRHLQTLEDAASTAPPALVLLLPQHASGPAQRLLQAWRECPAPSGTHLPALTVLRYQQLHDALPALRQLAAENRLAALFAPYLIGVEDQWRDDGLPQVPLLLPIALTELGQEHTGVAQTLFQLPSLETQAQALMRMQAQAAGAPQRQLRVLHGADTPQAALQRIVAAARFDGWQVVLQSNQTPWTVGAETLLALTALPLPNAAAVSSPVSVLVPAMFLRPRAADAWTAQGAQVQVASAYPPQPLAGGAWIGPEQAWHALGCELLARLPALPGNTAGAPLWREQVAVLSALELPGWWRLPPRVSHADATDHVHIAAWKNSTRGRSGP